MALNSFWGSVISFVFAVCLLFLREFIVWIKERNRKRELFEDLFNGFSTLYKDEGCVLLFRTIPLILDDIQQKLQMITSFDYKKQNIYGDGMQNNTNVDIKNPEYMILWIYNHIWFFKLEVNFLFGTSKPEFSDSLYDMEENKYFSQKPEILIKFLRYLEDEYKKSKIIIWKKKTLLTDEIINSIKAHYSNKK